jgi:heme/copper-type cytochrome/quinol oxidase subunit 2
LILGIFVYGLALYDGRMMIAGGNMPFLSQLQLESWDLGFVLLGIVGLINHMVDGVVVSFVNIYLPKLTAQRGLAQVSTGFWISWIIAILVLLVTLFIMRERTQRGVHEPL